MTDRGQTQEVSVVRACCRFSFFVRDLFFFLRVFVFFFFLNCVLLFLASIHSILYTGSIYVVFSPHFFQLLLLFSLHPLSIPPLQGAGTPALRHSGHRRIGVEATLSLSRGLPRGGRGAPRHQGTDFTLFTARACRGNNIHYSLCGGRDDQPLSLPKIATSRRKCSVQQRYGIYTAVDVHL